MSDYNLYVGLLRDQMISALCENEEQLLYVLSGVLSEVTVEDITEFGQLEPHTGPADLVSTLRDLADAIESGQF